MIRLGLYILTFFLPFTWWRLPLNIKISEGVAIITILFLLLSMLKWRRPIISNPFLLPMLGIIAVATLSLFQMRLIHTDIYSEPWAYGRYHPDVSGPLSVSRYVFLLSFVILITNIINNEQILKKTLKIYLISGGIVSIIGILQLVAYKSNVSSLVWFVSLFSEGWYDTPLVPQYLGDIIMPRIMGPNNEPKMFSNTLVAIIPFTIISLIQKWTIFKKRVLWLLLILQIFALFLTFSASGWFGFVVSMLFMFMKLQKQGILNYLKAFISVIICFLISFLFVLRDMQISTFLTFNFHRIIYFFSSPATIGQLGPLRAGWEMFKEHPFLGVGIGNFPFHFNNYNILGLPPVDYAILGSNEYITILAETGLLGAISWLPFVYAFFKFIKFKNPFNSDNFFYSVFIASISATIGSWCQLWATYGIFNPHIWFPLALAVIAKRLSLYGMKNKE